MHTIQLNNQLQMPAIGLGVWQTKDGQEVIDAIHAALDAGYRHIDTAMIYKNEEGVGEAIKTASTARDQVFLTTKIWNTDIRNKQTAQALEDSLGRLQTDYVDLILLHWPVAGFEAAWEALENALESGKTRAIGLSNFMPEHLADIQKIATTVPAVNQIEFHPYLQQREVLAACAPHKISITAWSPLMQGNFKTEDLFTEIAAAHSKSPAQIVLRWNIQRGVITIPKSVQPKHIQDNFDIFDFSLSSEEMDAIDALEKAQRFGPDPRNFDF